MDFVPQAYLLDLDGTLVDSEPYHKRAEIETFARLGLAIEFPQLAPFTGMTLPQMLQEVGRQFDFHVLPDDFLQVQIPIFRKMIETQIFLFPDAVRFLDLHREHRKAIVTSSLPWYLEAISGVHPRLITDFELRICAADVESGKPHPEPFRTAAERLGVAPEHCMAIEDSVNGVTSAKEAGCHVLGIDRESLGHLAHAHRVVRSLDEVA